jgi:hypothetical protein
VVISENMFFVKQNGATQVSCCTNEKRKKTAPACKNLPCLRAAVRLAQKVGTGVE